MTKDIHDRYTLDIWLWKNPQLYSQLPMLFLDNSKDRDKPMNLEEFKEYIVKQRRCNNDQRTPTKDDTRKRSDVETNKPDESLHRNHKG